MCTTTKRAGSAIKNLIASNTYHSHMQRLLHHSKRIIASFLEVKDWAALIKFVTQQWLEVCSSVLSLKSQRHLIPVVTPPTQASNILQHNPSYRNAKCKVYILSTVHTIHTGHVIRCDLIPVTLKPSTHGQLQLNMTVIQMSWHHELHKKFLRSTTRFFSFSLAVDPVKFIKWSNSQCVNCYHYW